MFLAFLAGCTTAAFPHARKTSLDFLEDGKTAKEMVTAKLGQSFITFDAERIISYRLGKTREGYFVLARSIPTVPTGPAWLSGSEGKFNLILIFNENGILQRHSLVPID
jgi:hypothetical protein